MYNVRFTIDKHIHIAVYPLSPSICTSFPFFFFFVCVCAKVDIRWFSLTFSTFEKYYTDLITPKLGGWHTCVPVDARDSVWESVLSSHCVGSGDLTEVFRIGTKHLYQMRDLARTYL